ncbi:PP2C family protein-serine/threonine phosphatase [Klenkia brasiliensis]|uniref:Serine/threonine protein phosphatase PstP n=1 Tax=Klenkia brasiliensis TaxID=333142 RepID=A0A1G7XRB0_9ACTN|nr:PP2C family serine/threonine-protein phosphatase [Klenkia brasiliensis]SDG86240.1 protein phosphatase [Klenkia brasiliensis]
MTLVLRYAARSDRGLIRGSNQDSVYAGPRLLAVADGMGGHAAGDVASKVVIAALEHLDDDTPSGDMLSSLRNAVFDGSEHLREVIRESPELEGMGTTLTAVLFAGGRLALCHVGDSRAYLVRDGQLNQITHDDTFVQTLIDDGRITEDEANSHPQRSLLLRALNGQDVEPDLSMREARAGDRYLLCSDGLSGVVSHETMAEALRDPDPQATADRLVELALRSGGPDNITCIVADVVDDDGSSSIDPVVDGAAGDNRGQREVDPRSAAGRAALADPRPATPTASVATATPPVKRRRPLRTALLALAAVVVLGAAAVGFYAFVGNHWFVRSVDGGDVGVYRGINASLVGLDLYRLDTPTDLALTDLTQAARSRVESGIEASDRGDADRILSNLLEQRLPECRTVGATPSGSASSSPTTGAPGTTAPTTTAPPSDPAATAAPPTTTAPTTTTSTSTSTRTQEPGVDCREAD